MKTAIEIIGQDLRWHVDNPGASGKGDEYERAFINGIVHIHDLLINAHSSLPQDETEAARLEKDRCLEAMEELRNKYKSHYDSHIIGWVCDGIKARIEAGANPLPRNPTSRKTEEIPPFPEDMMNINYKDII